MLSLIYSKEITMKAKLIELLVNQIFITHDEDNQTSAQMEMTRDTLVELFKITDMDELKLILSPNEIAALECTIDANYQGVL